MPNRAVLLVLCAAAAAVSSAPARADRWIPSSARATGANGAVFVTDLRLLNTSETDTATVQLVYYPAGRPAFTSIELQIGPRQQKALNNVIETFLGVPGDSSGPIRVVAPDTVQTSSRTYNVTDPCSGGTFGTSIPALAPEAALSAGIVAQVAGSADTKTGFRTNLILTNPSDLDTADVEIVLRRGEGGQLGTVGRATKGQGIDPVSHVASARTPPHGPCTMCFGQDPGSYAGRGAPRAGSLTWRGSGARRAAGARPARTGVGARRAPRG